MEKQYRSAREQYEEGRQRVQELGSKVREMEKAKVPVYERSIHEVGLQAVKDKIRTESGRLKSMEMYYGW